MNNEGVAVEGGNDDGSVVGADKRDIVNMLVPQILMADARC
jgi:hypothetical protein